MKKQYFVLLLLVSISNSLFSFYKKSQPLAVTVTNIVPVTCNGACDGSALVTFTGAGTGPYTIQWISGTTTTFTNVVASPFTCTGLCAGNYIVRVTGTLMTQVANIVISEPSPIAMFVDSQTNATCNGLSDGSASVSVIGGTSPYTLQWNDPANQTGTAITNLSAGTFTCLITDANGCVGSDVVTIGNLNDGPIVQILDSANITCFGANDGSAIAVVSGGTLPYQSIIWIESGQLGFNANNLSPGLATIEVYDGAGCLGTDEVTIIEPSDIVTSIVSYQDVTCYNLFNGSAVVLATGGLYPTDSNWDNAYTISITSPTQTQAGVPLNTPLTFAGLGVGAIGSTHVYTVTVTDIRGCQDSTTFAISQPQALVISNPIVTNLSCYQSSDGQIGVTVNGGWLPYNFNWISGNIGFVNPGIPNISGLEAGTYTLSVVDMQGCTDNEIVTVNEPAPLLLDSIVSEATNGLPNGSATVFVNGGTPGYTYLWNTTPNQTTQTAIGLASNLYNVQVTDANGCIANTDVVIPNNVTGVKEFSNTIRSFVIGPNPAYHHFNIQATLNGTETCSLLVKNALGEIVDCVELGELQTIDYSYFNANLSEGVYFVSFITSSGTVSKKILIAK